MGFVHLLDSAQAGIPISLSLRNEMTTGAHLQAGIVARGLYSRLVLRLIFS